MDDDYGVMVLMLVVTTLIQVQGFRLMQHWFEYFIQ
jgi:hypothetical protein